ncbi:hypothetical protein [Clostridium tarantellae]|uniref:Glycine zipper family protein n=1 Tax=Clostridium tarantellae TaxID=39493 RepID=A0A6I1MKJ9_9CLOT|nr:hypothetical protein [Clostridium tarantellae]MPQ42657.1 hypothetical protein [Clostridium tarantellae]
MWDKLALTDKENEHLTMSIAVGVAIGLMGGAFFSQAQLGFALGGVIGVITSLAYSCHKRFKKAKNF